MLATPIGSSAKALDENMPAAAVAAVVCRNRLRLRFIAVALLTVPSQDFTDTNDPGARWNWIEPPSRSRFLFEHDLFGKPLHTFPDHAPGFLARQSPVREKTPEMKMPGTRPGIFFISAWPEVDR